ncbi:hypothetical protein [Aquimarina sp. 433]
MKKKKLNGLSLKKNVISRLGSQGIKGGFFTHDDNRTEPVDSRCDCGSGITVIDRTKDCILTDDGESFLTCDSYGVHCL